MTIFLYQYITIVSQLHNKYFQKSHDFSQAKHLLLFSNLESSLVQTTISWWRELAPMQQISTNVACFSTSTAKNHQEVS